jgi:hypothetical protein
MRPSNGHHHSHHPKLPIPAVRREPEPSMCEWGMPLSDTCRRRRNGSRAELGQMRYQTPSAGASRPLIPVEFDRQSAPRHGKVVILQAGVSASQSGKCQENTRCVSKHEELGSQRPIPCLPLIVTQGRGPHWAFNQRSTGWSDLVRPNPKKLPSRRFHFHHHPKPFAILESSKSPNLVRATPGSSKQL